MCLCLGRSWGGQSPSEKHCREGQNVQIAVWTKSKKKVNKKDMLTELSLLHSNL